jgi:plastocyanin
VERLKQNDAAQRLSDAAAGLTGADPRAALASLREGIVAYAASIDGELQRLERFAAHAGASLGRNVEVRIIDAAPYFEPATVEVHAGDTVLWKYDLPSDGHSISHALHRVAIEGTGVIERAASRRASATGSRRRASMPFATRRNRARRALALVKVVTP